MKDYDMLIDRFESIPDMPVSEEVLGAYLEGSLDPEQQMIVDGMVSCDPELSDMVWMLSGDDTGAFVDGAGLYDGFMTDGVSEHGDGFDDFFDGNHDDGHADGCGDFYGGHPGGYDNYDSYDGYDETPGRSDFCGADDPCGFDADL